MKRRHSGHTGHMGSGAVHNANRRPQGRYNNHGNNGGFQKPRKNFPALREKYMNMAKEAISVGDRVLAEYYLQHAEHYYRMQQEYMAERAARQPQLQHGQQADEMPEDNNADSGDSMDVEVNIPNNSNVLPAFLTRQVAAQPTQDENKAMAAAASWDEEQ